jgi:hypothetical protein
MPIYSKRTLPQHRSHDCSIDLEPGTQPPYGRVYNLQLGKATRQKVSRANRHKPKLLEVIESDSQGPFPIRLMMALIVASNL